MYDKTKVGKLIASGGDRKVYHYGDGQVVKISHISFVIGRKWQRKLTHDYEVCKKYFPQFVVETTDVTPPRSFTHIEIQNFITGELFSKKHLADARVREQFTTLLAQMQKLTG